MMITAWKLPLIVAAIAIAIVGGFDLGGPGLGMAVGALAAATIVFLAARKPPLRAIDPPAADDLRRHILVVLQEALEEPAVVEATVAAIRPGAADVFEPEVLLVAPSPNRFLDRWTSDLVAGRALAQRALVLSAAALAGAEIAARARVGDEEVVQTVEDELASFPATEVVLVGGSGGGPDARAIADLRTRLRVPLRHVTGAGGVARRPATEHSSLSRPAPRDSRLHVR